MAPRAQKIKPNNKSHSKPINLPVCGDREKDGFWYPSEAFVEKAHEIMIERYGGHTGFERGINIYLCLIEEIKQIEGTYMKAAMLLQGIAVRRIFQDGNHRTAYIATKTFLEMNDGEINEKDDLKVIKFIKEIRNYNLNQVESWLKDGKL